MVVHRYNWSHAAGWSDALPSEPNQRAQLVLCFGPVDAPNAQWFDRLRELFPTAEHVYCSGGGQIDNGSVEDDVTVVSVIEFAQAKVHAVVQHHVDLQGSADAGRTVGLAMRDVAALQHVLVFAEGLTFSADAFVAALNEELPAAVKVSGGLASNGPALSRTVVGLNAPPTAGTVAAIGLSGASLVIGTGSVGGWDLFGPERVVTRSETAVVFELDGENALTVYKRYLGDFASELPGIALLFPLAVWPKPGGPRAVRTILAIDEAAGSLRFAGDIPQGSTVRLMRTTTDKLVEGAAQAAQHARTHGDDGVAPQLALCVSCIGRRAVMRSRVEEELDEIVLASGGAPVVGFYSNGEIAPPSDGREFAQAVLHNQTMTVTTIGER